MSIRIDVHHFFHGSNDELLTQIIQKLDLALEGIETMSAELDRLTAAVSQNTTVDESIITLVRGLAQQLRDMASAATELADLKSSINSMAGDLEAANQKVADAVAENTEAPPAP